MPKTLKILISSLAFTMVLGAVNLAKAADIDVVFPDRLASNMGSLNDIERERERSFRETKDDNASQRGRSGQFLSVTKLSNVTWAYEDLVPNVDDLTVEGLFDAMASAALDRAGMDNLQGTVRFTIRKIKVANHSLNFLGGRDSYIVGTVEHIGSNGQVLKSENISASLTYKVSVDSNYSGPDFAFYAGDLEDRIGPTLARFIQKGLERLFDDKDFSGPIIIG